MKDPGKRDFDAAAASWDAVPARIEMARAIAEAILARVPVRAEMEALDYGAGTGLLTLALRPRVRSVTAADSSPGMLAQLDAKIAASGLDGVRTLLLDLAVEPPPADRFDLIVTAMTLHHIENVPALLRALSGMLRPGGWLAAADLDSDGGEFHPDPAGVWHNGFERAEMHRMFAEAGLAEVTVETAHTLARPVEGRGVREFSVFLVAGRTDAAQS